MSAHQIRSTPLPLFAVLLGALAFNLSAWPTSDSFSNVQSTSLSSQVDSCVADQLELGDSAECKISDEIVSGSVSAELVERQVRDRSQDDPKAMKPVSEWKIEVCMRPTKPLSDDGAGVINGNPDCEPARVKTMEEVAGKVIEITTAKKAAIEDRIKADAELQERRALCEIDAKGKEITDDVKRIECKMARTKKMSSEEAATYFSQEIQPQLQEMVGCTGSDIREGFGGLSSGFGSSADQRKCAAQRAKGIKLLQSLSNKYSRNTYISQSLKDLRVFANYAKETETLTAMGNLPANDPRQRLAAEALQRLQANWGTYMNQRGLSLNSMRSPLGWETFSVSETLSSDLSGYNTDINQSFTRIAQMHQQYVSGQQTTGANIAAGVTPISAGNGRQLRGMPSTSYMGAPGSLSSQQQMSPMSTQPTQNGRAGTGLNGSGIVKPQLGQPVR